MVAINQIATQLCSKLALCSFLLLSYIYKVSYSSSVVLKADNINDVLHHNELVFVNFYADWCRFSNLLAPIFDEAAASVQKEFPQQGKVVLGKIDCDSETSISTQYQISKYPTLKLFRDGQVMKKEYRGQRSAESLATYIKEQLRENVDVKESSDDLADANKEKSAIIAYMEKADSANYAIFQRMARSLRDDCHFYAVFGDASSLIREGADKIMFKPKMVGDESPYTGEIGAYETLQAWGSDKCVPLVREITFENAEELTEEGLPFLILFHHPDDKETVTQFTEMASGELLSERTNVNFLVADGLKFSHPLHHLGKAESDLPVLAIDSFRHMYIFPDVKKLAEPGKLKQFVLDLHAGKLHREFHHGPDADTLKIEAMIKVLSPEKTGDVGDVGEAGVVGEGGDIPRDNEAPVVEHLTEEVDGPSQPPKSTFVKLAPSSNRYTILKDEL